MEFKELKELVQTKFKELTKTGKLFYAEIDREEIYKRYLDGFTDPTERAGHDCNCCKSFLRQFGGIVTIVDNKVVSIWDVAIGPGALDEPYSLPIKNVRDYVKSLPVTDVFMNDFEKLGTNKNTDLKGNEWHHFHVVLPKEFIHKGSASMDTVKAELRDNKTVLKRALDEIKIDAVEAVLELIDQNSLYKGREFEALLKQFLSVQKEYEKIPAGLKDNYVWVKSKEVSQAICRIKNSSIGTLISNISEEMDPDVAVDKFEAMVAPTNYKRTTSVVTPRMVEEAKKKINELGLLGSLERRFATPTDIDVNNVLFVDKSSSLTDVFEDIKKDAEVNPKSFSKIEEVSIDDFIEKILPKSKALGILLENSHLNNMTTLLTAVDKDAPLLFKWGNPFSWSYTGGITDSIKERVKAAGGNVNGVLRVSLSWYNHDDLDIHVHEPSGYHIFYASKSNPTTTCTLDVDMNAGGGTSRTPVENIVWTNASKMLEGTYKVVVNNYQKRESSETGYVVQVECNGELFEFESKTSPVNGGSNTIIEFFFSREKGVVIKGEQKSSFVTKEKWGLKTNRFHKVKNIMLSPNYWGEKAIGNKHYMFLLENCETDESTRPFFNEFLKEELTPNRKFFEVLGNKLKLAAPTKQLSGIGFSETQRNHVIVQVEGAIKRTIKVNF